MKIPTMLAEYLEMTEQNDEEMTQADLLSEAKWVMNMNDSGDWCGTPSELRQMRAFIARLSKRRDMEETS